VPRACETETNAHGQDAARSATIRTPATMASKAWFRSERRPGSGRFRLRRARGSGSPSAVTPRIRTILARTAISRARWRCGHGIPVDHHIAASPHWSGARSSTASRTRRRLGAEVVEPLCGASSRTRWSATAHQRRQDPGSRRRAGATPVRGVQSRAGAGHRGTVHRGTLVGRATITVRRPGLR